MSLTRKMLIAMGIEDAKIDQIIEAHTETINGLKTERDTLKTQASKADELETKLKDALAKGDYTEKYNAEHKAFEEYKAKIALENETNAKKTAYRKLLTDAGVDKKRLDTIMKVTNLSDVKLKDGEIVDADKLTETAKSEWADFIVTQGTQGANVANPPANAPSAPDYEHMTMDEYVKARKGK